MKQDSFQKQLLALLNHNKKWMDGYEKFSSIDKKFIDMDNQKAHTNSTLKNFETQVRHIA